jgi:hypothetical protein
MRMLILENQLKEYKWIPWTLEDISTCW